MAIKKAKLGFTDWADGDILYADDLNDTQDDIIKQSAIGQAQNAFQTLQANDVFQNQDLLACDEFVAVSGTNTTVNTGSTTALYESGLNYYGLNQIENAIVSDSLTDTKTEYNTSGTISSDGIFITVPVHIQDAGTGTLFVFSNGSLLTSGLFTGTNEIINMTFDESDYPNFFSSGDSFDLVTSGHNGDVLIARGGGGSIYNFNGTHFDYTNVVRPSGTIAYQTAASGPANLICDTGTLTLDGTETAAAVYMLGSIGASGNVGITYGDGTTEIAGGSISNNYSSLTDISSLSTGTLKLNFDLSTQSSGTTPKIYGYGVRVIR